MAATLDFVGPTEMAAARGLKGRRGFGYTGSALIN